MAIAEPPVITDTPLTDEIDELWPVEEFFQGGFHPMIDGEGQDMSKSCILAKASFFWRTGRRDLARLIDHASYDIGSPRDMVDLNDTQGRDAVLAYLRQFERKERANATNL